MSEATEYYTLKEAQQRLCVGRASLLHLLEDKQIRLIPVQHGSRIYRGFAQIDVDFLMRVQERWPTFHDLRNRLGYSDRGFRSLLRRLKIEMVQIQRIQYINPTDAERAHQYATRPKTPAAAIRERKRRYAIQWRKDQKHARQAS